MLNAYCILHMNVRTYWFTIVSLLHWLNTATVAGCDFHIVFKSSVPSLLVCPLPGVVWVSSVSPPLMTIPALSAPTGDRLVRDLQRRGGEQTQAERSDVDCSGQLPADRERPRAPARGAAVVLTPTPRHTHAHRHTQHTHDTQQTASPNCERSESEKTAVPSMINV